MWLRRASAAAVQKHVAPPRPPAVGPQSARSSRQLAAYLDVADEALRPPVDRAHGLAIQPQRLAVHVAGVLPCSQTDLRLQRVKGALTLVMCKIRLQAHLRSLLKQANQCALCVGIAAPNRHSEPTCRGWATGAVSAPSLLASTKTIPRR